MKIGRPPDLFVVGESGGRFPAYLQGQLKEGSPLLIAFTASNPTAPFVIDPGQCCLVTFAGTHLEVPIEPADPPTATWEYLTADPCEEWDGRPDPSEWPAYPDLLPR